MSMTPDQKTDEAHAQAAVDHLAERFDAVLVLASRYTPETGCTTRVVLGAGNYYARRGMVEDWLDLQQAEAYIDQREEGEE
jgi:hypothetical protein